MNSWGSSERSGKGQGTVAGTAWTLREMYVLRFFGGMFIDEFCERISINLVHMMGYGMILVRLFLRTGENFCSAEVEMIRS